MKPTKVRPIVKILLVAWSAVYLPLAMLIVWVGTGPNALAGPSTLAENIFAGMWLALSVSQFFIARALDAHYRPWLFWIAITLAGLTFGSVILGPILALFGIA